MIRGGIYQCYKVSSWLFVVRLETVYTWQYVYVQVCLLVTSTRMYVYKWGEEKSNSVLVKQCKRADVMVACMKKYDVALMTTLANATSKELVLLLIACDTSRIQSDDSAASPHGARCAPHLRHGTPPLPKARQRPAIYDDRRWPWRCSGWVKLRSRAFDAAAHKATGETTPIAGSSP